MGRNAIGMSLALVMAAMGSASAGEVQTINGTITIPDAPQRILVLNPALAGTVFALDLDVLAVTATTRSPTAEGFSIFWADLARADGTQVLPWNFDAFDLELIQSYQPDLIIAGGQGRPGNLAVGIYDKLSLIAPTLLVDSAIGTWQGELDFLSTALGRTEQAETVLATYAERIAEVRDAIVLPPQPTVFFLSIDEPYFLPETTAAPQLFAELGFEPDALTEKFPQFKAFGTGDSVKVGLELVPDVFAAPTMIVIPWTAGSPDVAALKADSVYSFLPSLQSGNAYDFPDYTYRFDYYTALAVLDKIAETFAKP